jgi:hypothetical protein
MDELKARLLGDRLAQEDVDIPGVGTIRVRGLSHEEVLLMQKTFGSTANVDGSRALLIQRRLIAAGMVQPKMTEAEVHRWQRNAKFGELDLASDAISRLSGLEEAAVKTAHKSVPDEPGKRVRVLPGAEVGVAVGGADEGGSEPR